MEKTIRKAEELWELLGNIPFQDDLSEEDFIHFPVGSSRLDIWHWFEQHFNIILAEELMYGKKIYARYGGSDIVCLKDDIEPKMTETYFIGYEDRDGAECTEEGTYL